MDDNESLMGESTLDDESKKIYAEGCGYPVRMYSCRFCNKLQPCPAKLRRHERTHTGEKPFVCEICGKLFARLDSVKKHVMTMHLRSVVPQYFQQMFPQNKE